MTAPMTSSTTLPLRLSVHPEDGCLLTAPLGTVINAATDSLYRDLHEMTYGTVSLAVPTSATAAAVAANLEASMNHASASVSNLASGTMSTTLPPTNTSSIMDSLNNIKYSVHSSNMSSLSFAQRRFQLASTITHHARSISHIAALVASYLPVSGCSSSLNCDVSSSNDGPVSSSLQPREGELSHIVIALTNQALHRVQMSWRHADEAQDALYFSHAALYKNRKPVHDIYGALEVMLTGSWTSGMSHDVTLLPRVYDWEREQIEEEIMERKSNESDGCSSTTWKSDHPEGQISEFKKSLHRKSASNTRMNILQRLQSAVRAKLILGEVGSQQLWRQRQQPSVSQACVSSSKGLSRLPWDMTLEQNGTVLKLTYGKPRRWNDVIAYKRTWRNGNKKCKMEKEKKGKLQYPLVAFVTVLSEQAPTAALARDEEENMIKHRSRLQMCTRRTVGEEPNTNIETEEASRQESNIQSRYTYHSVASWTLLSIEINVHPKIGESMHQLEPTSRQIYDLHRICAKNMAKEEAGAFLARTNPTGKPTDKMPRPLDSLFDTMFAFSLSLQMEVLSAQAEGLKKKTWNECCSTDKVPSDNHPAAVDFIAPDYGIVVSPVVYVNKKEGTSRQSEMIGKNYDFDGTSLNEKEALDGKIAQVGIDMNAYGNEDCDNDDSYSDPHRNINIVEPLCQESPAAVMAIHFWSVDDRYGSPKMGRLTLDKMTDSIVTYDERSPSASNLILQSDCRHSRRLTLEIRAIQRVGIEVSLSGGDEVMHIVSEDNVTRALPSDSKNNLRRNIDKLLRSLQDPFRLSVSDALLAATVICAERRCAAVVTALLRSRTTSGPDVNSQTFMGIRCLPSWLHLTVDCGSITVSAQISYGCQGHNFVTSYDKRDASVVLFRLACESRTGRFITVFPRSASLLRLLSCNDSTASDIQVLRQTAAAIENTTSSLVKRRHVTQAADKDLTGRFVRDSFEALHRSVDTLGRRVGVGGEWNDIDSMSSALRGKAIDQACGDVIQSLRCCCAISSVFGVVALAMGVSTGVDAMPDLAGGPIQRPESEHDCISIPPLSIILSQRMTQHVEVDKYAEGKIIMKLQRDLIGVSASVTDEDLRVLFFDITVELESLASIPNRIRCQPMILKDSHDEDTRHVFNLTQAKDTDFIRHGKRARVDDNFEDGRDRGMSTIHLSHEIQYLAARIISSL